MTNAYSRALLISAKREREGPRAAAADQAKYRTRATAATSPRTSTWGGSWREDSSRFNHREWDRAHLGCMGLQRRRVSRSTFETWRMRSARGPLPRGRRGCGGSRDDGWVRAAAHFHFFLARSLLVAPFGGQYTRRTGTDISNQVEVADSTKQRLESRDTDDLSLCLPLPTGGDCVLEFHTTPALAYCRKLAWEIPPNLDADLVHWSPWRLYMNECWFCCDYSIQTVSKWEAGEMCQPRPCRARQSLLARP